MSSATVGIFVATMTGTAELCAEEIGSALAGAGIEHEIRLMDGLDAAALKGFGLIVVVSSTYGHGEIPDNGQALFESIEAAEILGGISFAVFGLGDRTYAATFCEGGRQWDALLERKGGSRFAPLKQHDASSGELAEDAAGAWATDWVNQLKKAA